MEERKKLTAMLKDFQSEQKELLAQAEQRLEVNDLNIFALWQFNLMPKLFSLDTGIYKKAG